MPSVEKSTRGGTCHRSSLACGDRLATHHASTHVRTAKEGGATPVGEEMGGGVTGHLSAVGEALLLKWHPPPQRGGDHSSPFDGGFQPRKEPTGSLLLHSRV